MKKAIIFLFTAAILSTFMPSKILAKNFEESRSDAKQELSITDYKVDKIEEQGNKLGIFLFKYILPIVAVVSGAYGIFMAFFTSSIGPLIKYGAIALACLIMPYIISGITHASSILLN